MLLCRLTQLCLIVFATQSASAQTVDEPFGVGGHQTHGFAQVNGYNRDHAVVACAGPNRTLLVAGIASNTERVVVIRIGENGALDTTFSTDGKESFMLPIRPLYAEFAVGACQADGAPLIALPAHANNEEDVQLVRINPNSGLPDPQFGVNGFLTVDLDSYAAGLGNTERPIGLNIAANGMIDVTGQAITDGTSPRRTGFIVRVNSSGVAVAGRVEILAGFQDTTYTAAGLATNGQLWVAGHGFRNGSNVSLKAVLDPQTLQHQSAPVIGANIANTGRGRFVGPDILATIGRKQVTTGNGITTTVPVVLVHRTSGSTQTEFPALAPIGANATEVSPHLYDGDLIPLPDGRILIAGSVHVEALSTEPRGVYFGAMHLANGQQPDRVDPAFGTDGLWQTQYIDRTSGCTSPVDQSHRRTTLWNGRVTIVGQARTGACHNNADFDYWISRIRVEVLFGSGFE